MVRIGPMASPKLPLNRRDLMAGLGAAALIPAWPATGRAQGQVQAGLSVALQARADALALRDGPPTPVWSLQGPELSFKRGDTLEVAFANELPAPAVLNWRGIDGASAAEPLTGRAPLAAGGKQSLQLPLRDAGTFLCDLGLLGDGQARPPRARAVVVRESEAIAVDRDEVLLIEDWRVLPDGTAMAPGVEPKDAMPIHTVNGRTSFEISVRTNERVRFRFISACQRAVIATKIENFDVRVMAIDGQPSEPFQARNGALVLAPGSRADAFIDVTGPAGTSSAILLHDGKEARPVGKLVVSSEPPIRPAPLPPAPPLPSNGLPERIELKGATRVDLALGGAAGDWMTPAGFTATSAPAFRAKTGRTVVLALTNRAAIATVFHLHGHHFRLLDRLDDGWKPFWLDTLAIEPGQTQRIAFLAEHAGRYLIESAAADWAAPRLVRWYAVE
ncbi:multicopper oxidase family protein [Bradyrhizobium archetypum]|uniref:Multicopper oxidase domain-containing protein n=1 Tax=Bradyrhizobium archetypum TaxID=2721160 RepID=A0A7Y4H936_9BRAD|nr:multicopper oxidase domain-containing protein [Bradyrhizobium archetypum]NOJ49447.1 multicopper oxidase domain-containing protein [Bradyrhizobium archetypum]